MKKLACLIAVAVCAQSPIEAPALARVLDQGRLTQIYGLAGNFVRGEDGAALLAYSFDGDIEWRLEPGRVSANGAVLAVTETEAVFRGATVTFPRTGEIWRYDGESIVRADAASSTIAGRLIEWRDGQLFVTQPGGEIEVIDCPAEPSSITAAGAGWAHWQGYLLRLAKDRVALFVLPERRRE
ncbi:MAG: hypothetical protein FJW32_10275 [Acidobacteria bacterium]|nr:hypothetical protein [Acidobacteriota bacterium]